MPRAKWKDAESAPGQQIDNPVYDKPKGSALILTYGHDLADIASRYAHQNDAIDTELIEQERQAALMGAIQSLKSHKQRYVMILRCGLFQSRFSLSEVGKRLSVSPEAVRKIEARALENLRTNKNLKLFFKKG